MRSQFLLRPDVTFLNHGSFGACPAEVFDSYQRWQRELESEPVEFIGRRFPDLMRTAREALGTFIGADADDVVFVPNATTAINTVARTLPLEPGDEILTTDLEYGALDRAWEAVCAFRGSRYVRRHVTLPVTDHDRVADEVWAGVTERTRVLFISHITSTTALTLPAETLVRRAAERGIITVVDGAHAPGQIPLDMRSLGADFYTGNCHKWMMTPKGCAFLYARQPAQRLVKPIVVSWGDKSGSSSDYISELEFQGTTDFAAYLTLPDAIGFMQKHDWDNVRSRCHALVNKYRAAMRSITDVPSLSPDSPYWYAQMSAHPLPACDGEALQRVLFDKHHIEIPVTEGPDGTQYLRVSVQGYNTEADIDYLLSTVQAVLPKFRRPARA